MIIGIMINNLIAYYLNSFWSGRFIGYSFRNQIYNILPVLAISLSMGGLVYIVGIVLPFKSWLILIIQIIIGALCLLIILEVTINKDYKYHNILITNVVRGEFNEKK